VKYILQESIVRGTGIGLEKGGDLKRCKDHDSIYIGYPESKFRWAIKKKTSIYFQTIYIAI
jgi:hypothetical protein